MTDRTMELIGCAMIGYAARDVLSGLGRVIAWAIDRADRWRLDRLVREVRADAWTRHEELEADRAALSTVPSPNRRRKPDDTERDDRDR